MDAKQPAVHILANAPWIPGFAGITGEGAG